MAAEDVNRAVGPRVVHAYRAIAAGHGDQMRVGAPASRAGRRPGGGQRRQLPLRRQRGAQRVERLGRPARLRRLDREQQAELRIARPVQQRLGGQRARGGDLALVERAPALDERDDARHDREHRQHHEGRHAGAREADRAPVLAHLLAGDLVLGLAVQRRGELGDGVAEARVRQRQVLGLARPAQVDVARLLAERAVERGRDRVGGALVEVAALLVPRELALGERDEQRLGGLVLAPVRRLAVDPFGLRGARRGHEDVEARPVEGRDDRRPQVRVGRQRRLVAEDPQRAHAIPGLGEALQAAL
jgi:hypothetical protein